jgi:predicted hotdog family 3-hydroxylacyl-ACP dehydratase
MEGANPNPGLNLDIEAMIPHRDRMRLIDTVLAVDDGRAVTAATITEDWPLCQEGSVDVLVTIELVAQTAALLEGFKRLQSGRGGVTGWLVGIKTAEFSRPRLPLQATLVTEVAKSYALESYAVFGGTVRVGDQIVAAVSIQTFRPEAPDMRPPEGSP